MNVTIAHDEERQRFAADLEQGEAVVDYRLLDDGTLDLRRTFVTETLRGEGLAAEVVRTALDWARENDRKVVATCPYVSRFLERHPEYADLSVGATAP